MTAVELKVCFLRFDFRVLAVSIHSSSPQLGASSSRALVICLAPHTTTGLACCALSQLLLVFLVVGQLCRFSFFAVHFEFSLDCELFVSPPRVNLSQPGSAHLIWVHEVSSTCRAQTRKEMLRTSRFVSSKIWRGNISRNSPRCLVLSSPRLLLRCRLRASPASPSQLRSETRLTNRIQVARAATQAAEGEN